MKKRSFILLELFIALALVALFSLPFFQGYLFCVKKQKEHLLNLEKERKAEEFFYKICSKLTETHVLNDVGRAWKKNPFTLDSSKVIFDLGPLGQEQLYWHYHLYSNVEKKKSCRKFHCIICFTNDLKDNCDTSQKFIDAKYGFTLTINGQTK